MIYAELCDVVGEHIAADLSSSQREQLEAAIGEDRDGVAQLAQRVLADARISRPVPVLLDRLRRGRHRTRQRHDAQRLGQVDHATRRYHARRAAYPSEAEQDAIAYAVDYTVVDCPGPLTTTELEHALRQRIA